MRYNSPILKGRPGTRHRELNVIPCSHVEERDSVKGQQIKQLTERGNRGDLEERRGLVWRRRAEVLQVTASKKKDLFSEKKKIGGGG